MSTTNSSADNRKTKRTAQQSQDPKTDISADEKDPINDMKQKKNSPSLPKPEGLPDKIVIPP